MPTALVVDDDPHILELAEERLASMGHDCRTASSQAEAEELLDSQAFDYILLDLEIPRKSMGSADMEYGKNLLRKIVETPELARTPVIVITGHGLQSHHLSVEIMMMGASSFVGKPFGKENQLGEKILEVLRKHGVRSESGLRAPTGKLHPFQGGELVFFEDRVELCGVVVCGGTESSDMRTILDLLREKNTKNAYVKLALAELKRRGLGDVRDGAIPESVRRFRVQCQQRLRDQLGVDCSSGDVIANERRGYYFREWIVAKDGIDNTERAAMDRGMELTQNQKRIIQQLRKHAERTPRQLSDNLSLRAETITRELEGLLKSNLVVDIGSTRNRRFKLADAS